jgi:ribose 1,5-bisphosphate isomerase
MTEAADAVSTSAVDSLIDAIQQGTLLGASKQILCVADLFCRLARSDSAGSEADIAAILRDAGERIIELRGHEAPAVADAIRYLLAGPQTPVDRDEWADALCERAEALRTRIRKSQQDLAACGATVLAVGRGPVIVFDYSSSVLSVLAMCARNGHALQLVVPESRVLNGGVPIVAEALQQGHDVLFTADCAVGAYLPAARAVITGAEAILADGSCINTVGSFAVALLAQYYRVPLYIVSDVSKLYEPSYHGHCRPLRERTPIGLAAVVPVDVAGHPKLAVVSPEVERVPATFIAAYITDQGVIPPAAIYTVGHRQT